MHSLNSTIRTIFVLAGKVTFSFKVKSAANQTNQSIPKHIYGDGRWSIIYFSNKHLSIYIILFKRNSWNICPFVLQTERGVSRSFNFCILYFIHFVFFVRQYKVDSISTQNATNMESKQQQKFKCFKFHFSVEIFLFLFCCMQNSNLCKKENEKNVFSEYYL